VRRATTLLQRTTMRLERRITLLRRRLRHILAWKFVFYGLLLPVLRGLGRTRGDAILGLLGWLSLAMRPGQRRRLRAALARARIALDADWSIETTWPVLAANTARFLARDYPLDRQSDQAVLGRFEVSGYDRLRATLADGRGAILVGSHLGGHIAAVHWLFRRGIPLRLLVQRPRHISSELNRRFDAAGPHPQTGMFLRRDLSRAVAVERVFRARAALRDGLAIYLNGDIPWSGPNTYCGLLLGRPQRLLAIWTELAVLTGAPVFLVFCTHQPGGRFALELEAVGHLRPGEEENAVADYLRQLEARIAASPADAVAHLLWPCYQSPPPSTQPLRKRKTVRSRQTVQSASSLVLRGRLGVPSQRG
jgi:phosphatidylinositol dimannoside acyltransferase